MVCKVAQKTGGVLRQDCTNSLGRTIPLLHIPDPILFPSYPPILPLIYSPPTTGHLSKYPNTRQRINLPSIPFYPISKSILIYPSTPSCQTNPFSDLSYCIPLQYPCIYLQTTCNPFQPGYNASIFLYKCFAITPHARQTKTPMITCFSTFLSISHLTQ